MKKKKLPLSVFIITKNEEERISYALDSVKDIAEEIIVIDSGSEDKTLDIAKKFGAQTYYKEWKGYGLQKKYGESLCKNDWVLNLDADEALSIPLKHEIINLFRSGEINKYSGYILDIRLIIKKESEVSFFTPNNLYIRLYNKNFASFSDSAVHDVVIVKTGQTLRLKEKVFHRCFKSFDHQLDKINFYTSMQAENLYKNLRKPRVLRIIFEPFFAFFKGYFIKRWCFYGLAGIEQAYIYSYFRLIRLIKARNLFDAKNK
jgi:glycosyltransferase involved in cell wall biosynthesis